MDTNKQPLFQTMVEISNSYGERLQEINQQVLKTFSSRRLISTLEEMSNKVAFLTDGIKDMIPETLCTITESMTKSYTDLFSSNSFNLSEAMINALSIIQTDTLFQLSRCVQTNMIKNMTACFAQARYASLPQIVTESLSKVSIGASDFAFLRAAKLLPTLGEEVKYPYGFKTSLTSLNAGAAEDLLEDDEITYNTYVNCFTTGDAEARSAEMNVICAGRIILNSKDEGELFSEKELMNFASFLSQTPTLAMINSVGKRIYNYI